MTPVKTSDTTTVILENCTMVYISKEGDIVFDLQNGKQSVFDNKGYSFSAIQEAKRWIDELMFDNQPSKQARRLSGGEPLREIVEEESC